MPDERPGPRRPTRKLPARHSTSRSDLCFQTVASQSLATDVSVTCSWVNDDPVRDRRNGWPASFIDQSSKKKMRSIGRRRFPREGYRYNLGVKETHRREPDDRVAFHAVPNIGIALTSCCYGIDVAFVTDVDCEFQGTRNRPTIFRTPRQSRKLPVDGPLLESTRSAACLQLLSEVRGPMRDVESIRGPSRAHCDCLRAKIVVVAFLELHIRRPCHATRCRRSEVKRWPDIRAAGTPARSSVATVRSFTLMFTADSLSRRISDARSTSFDELVSDEGRAIRSSHRERIVSFTANTSRTVSRDPTRLGLTKQQIRVGGRRAGGSLGASTPRPRPLVSASDASPELALLGDISRVADSRPNVTRSALEKAVGGLAVSAAAETAW